ncbi:MAG: hypothetical protein ABIO92_10065 [Chloroflexia bacterium]
MEHVSIEQAFQYCLENPDNLSTAQLLSKFPQHRDELELLLAFDTQLNKALPLEMPPDSKALVKQRLVDRVAAGRADHAAEKDGPTIKPRAGKAEVPGIPWWRRRAFAGAAAALLVGLLWWQSATSLPDNPLYPVKLGTEDLLLNFTVGPTGLIQGHLNLGNMRLLDIRSMQSGNGLNRVGPAVDNYRYHIGNCLNLWQEHQDATDVDLAKLIYASSVAGQRTLDAMGGSGNNLSAELRSNIQDTATTIDKLQSSSSRILRDANIDLDPVLKDIGGTLSSLLLPAPGTTPTVTAVAAPTSTVTPGTSTPTVTSTVTSTVSPTVTQGLPSPELPSPPTLTAVFQAAQTIIAQAGPSQTPLSAAETVVAGGAGTSITTPMANAIQTMLAQPTFIVPAQPELTPTPIGTLTLIAGPQLILTAIAVPTTPLPATAVRAPSATPVVKTVLPSPTFPLLKPSQP